MHQSLVGERSFDRVDHVVVVGLRTGTEFPDQLAVPANEELMKIPGRIGARLIGQLLKERV